MKKRSQEFGAFRKCVKGKCEAEQKAFKDILTKSQPECAVTCREKNPTKDAESRKAFFQCIKESNCNLRSAHKTAQGTDEAKAFNTCKKTNCQAELDALRKRKADKDESNNSNNDVEE